MLIGQKMYDSSVGFTFGKKILQLRIYLPLNLNSQPLAPQWNRRNAIIIFFYISTVLF